MPCSTIPSERVALGPVRPGAVSEDVLPGPALPWAVVTLFVTCFRSFRPGKLRAWGRPRPAHSILAITLAGRDQDGHANTEPATYARHVCAKGGQRSGSRSRVPSSSRPRLTTSARCSTCGRSTRTRCAHDAVRAAARRYLSVSSCSHARADDARCSSGLGYAGHHGAGPSRTVLPRWPECQPGAVHGGGR
jgi:hypothetical protein